jgi:uncharacterized protein (DUF1499 family)
MIPCVARIVAASCASTLTACVMWGGGNGVEISHAIDSVPVVGASIATTTTNANTATLGLVTDGGENPVGRLQPCPYESNCVSSNFLEPPNRYVSPLKTFRDRETAFARAIKDLRDAESSGKTKVVEILPRQYYLHVTVPGTSMGSLDDVEILFGDNDEGIVHLRCQARVTLPPPPFCLKKNCINGNMEQRTRADRIATTLGLPPADRERMESAKWTPIFFNSDRVPGFDDEF